MLAANVWKAKLCAMPCCKFPINLICECTAPAPLPELPAVLADSRYSWDPDAKPEDRNRRSIYVFAKRNMRLPLFEAFDQPDMHNSCPRRTNTTTAPQALELLNGELTDQAARHWSGKLLYRLRRRRSEAGPRGLYRSLRPAAARRRNPLAEKFIDAEAETIAARYAHSSTNSTCPRPCRRKSIAPKPPPCSISATPCSAPTSSCMSIN